MTSSVSAMSEVEREEPGGESLLPPATAKKILGLASRDWTSFHGLTTYWMIKKAPSCTVHSIENTASHQIDGVGQYTVLTVSPGEADQTSEILVPQWCHFAESHATASSSTRSTSLSAVLG